jgi:chromate transporter
MSKEIATLQHRSLTALIGVVSLAVLFRWKVSNPALIAATVVVGLIAFPILEPTWVMVK